MPVYNTFREAVSAMRDHGFTYTFSFQNQQIYCPELDTTIEPERLTVVEQHHVDTDGMAANEKEVYGVRIDNNKLGLMTSTYAEYDPEGFEQIFRRCKKA